MDITIRTHPLQGEIQSIPSKSIAHRYLICAAFANNNTTLVCPETNRDIEATVDCLNALGASIQRCGCGYEITPISVIPEKATLNCCESGSTLRFLLPIVCALGIDATFHLQGRLPQRPLSPLWEEMERMGCTLSRPTANTIRCTGALRSGEYQIEGSVSSQFVSGLLLALPLIKEPASLQITGTLESKPYVEMTRKALALFGAPGSVSPGTVIVEGDWSNAAFWLAAQAMGSSVEVLGLNPDSTQGDRAVSAILPRMSENITISAADIPDLIPILSIVAAANSGATFTNIQRLRLKESDRVYSTIRMIESLGGKATATESSLTVYGTGLLGGTVDPMNDHRIAMAAAIGATVCKQEVTIIDAECVKKSYPGFWKDFSRLGGKYELNLR